MGREIGSERAEEEMEIYVFFFFLKNTQPT